MGLSEKKVLQRFSKADFFEFIPGIPLFGQHRPSKEESEISFRRSEWGRKDFL